MQQRDKTPAPWGYATGPRKPLEPGQKRRGAVASAARAALRGSGKRAMELAGWRKIRGQWMRGAA